MFNCCHLLALICVDVISDPFYDSETYTARSTHILSVGDCDDVLHIGNTGHTSFSIMEHRSMNHRAEIAEAMRRCVLHELVQFCLFRDPLFFMGNLHLLLILYQELHRHNEAEINSEGHV